MIYLLLALPFIGSALLFLDQYRNHGRFVDPEDVDNHETIALLLAGIGAGMLILWAYLRHKHKVKQI